jgi:hypothetical protein
MAFGAESCNKIPATVRHAAFPSISAYLRTNLMDLRDRGESMLPDVFVGSAL